MQVDDVKFMVNGKLEVAKRNKDQCDKRNNVTFSRYYSGYIQACREILYSIEQYQLDEY